MKAASERQAAQEQMVRHLEETLTQKLKSDSSAATPLRVSGVDKLLLLGSIF